MNLILNKEKKESLKSRTFFCQSTWVEYQDMGEIISAESIQRNKKKS